MHGKKICEYGWMHAQCRCPNDGVIKIKCDNATHTGIAGPHYDKVKDD